MPVRDSWNETFRELLIKITYCIWAYLFVLSIISDQIQSYVSLALAAGALLVFAFHPVKSTEFDLDSEPEADAAPAQ